MTFAPASLGAHDCTRQHSMAPQTASGGASRGPIIQVLVGPSEDAFHVYNTLLVDRSPFLEAALTGDEEEANAESFELFIYWVYTEKYILKAMKT